MEDIQFNKEDFYILGSGGLARELESWIGSSDFSEKYNLIGYIDDNLKALDGIVNDYEVLGVFKEGELWKEQNILLGIASCDIKEYALKVLLDNKCTVLSFKHKMAIVGNNSSLGIGHTLCPFVVISCNVIVGKCVTINSGSQIGHDVTVGDYSSIMANVDIGGGAVIGKNVFIGSNAVILPGVKIPDNTRIGAGAVVLKTIRATGTYFGNPSKKIF